MNRIKNLIIKYKQFILFCIVGISNTVVALVVSFLMLKLFNLLEFKPIVMGFSIIAGVCSVIGDIAGAVNSYILNSKFVFEGRNKNSGVKFIISFIIYAALSALMVMIFNKVFSIPEDYCKLIVTPIMFIENYIVNKVWVFRRKNSET